MNEDTSPSEPPYFPPMPPPLPPSAVPPPPPGFGPPPSPNASPQYAAGGTPPRRINPLALTSMIVGIASIPLTCFCGLGALAGIPAIVLGVIGLRQVKRDHTQAKGFAIAGIACGGVGTASTLLYLLFVLGAELAK